MMNLFKIIFCKNNILLFIFCLASAKLFAKDFNNSQDTSKSEKFNFHCQLTTISQYHPSFAAKYYGKNSLDSNAEFKTSVSATLFLGAKLWKGAQAYFNPEMSGGEGFSKTTGIAGFTNGEIYRVSNPAPHIFVARLYLRQVFALTNEKEKINDEANQLAAMEPKSYISITAGKFSVLDYFEDNIYSHDPRTDFLNWALMGNGAWDYSANTRGYTYGLVAEYISPQWAVRFSSVAVPLEANQSVMDANFLRSNSEAIEIEKNYSLDGNKGNIHLIGFLTQARMGNYREALDIGISDNTAPDIVTTRLLGRTKFGGGINLNQELSKNIGFFARASWSDGRNETWCFTEIDRAGSAGLVFAGDMWKRKNDKLGIAALVNGLSKDHRDYLKAGGYGFLIGDGNLNYAPEFITEVIYSIHIFKKIWISPDYQFVLNPAYNKDRGPVHVFSGRLHFEL